MPDATVVYINAMSCRFILPGWCVEPNAVSLWHILPRALTQRDSMPERDVQSVAGRCKRVGMLTLPCRRALSRRCDEYEHAVHGWVLLRGRGSATVMPVPRLVHACGALRCAFLRVDSLFCQHAGGARGGAR